MLKIALLVLTLTEDGATRVTLSATENAEGCEDLKAVVTAILTEGGTKVIAAMCGDSPIELTPFDHGAGPEDETHHYRVIITEGQSFELVPLSAGESCVPAPSAAPSVFCARSSQSVVKQ